MAAEWYTKQEKDVAAALNKGKTAAPEAGVPCTLVKMPDSLHLLCAGTNSAKTAALVKEAKSNGGKVVSAGTLYNGREGVTFAVSQGSLSIKKQFADATMAAIGKTMRVLIIAAPGAVLTDAPPGADAPGAPVAPAGSPAAAAAGDDGATQFKARATRLATAVKQAAAPVQATVQPLLVQALGLGKANRFAEAAPLLDRIEKSLAPAPAAPPAQASPAPAAAAANPGEAFKTRVKDLTAKLAATGAPLQATLKPRIVQALSLAKNNQYTEAGLLLDEVEKGLKAVPAAPAAAPPVPPAAKTVPPPPPSAKVAFTERLKGIKPRFDAAVQTNPPNKPVLEKAMAVALQSEKAGTYERAIKVLDGLEKALPRPSGDMAARLAESRDRWLNARETVWKGISNLQVKLKSHPDPRAQPIAEMGLNGVTGQLQVGLEAALQNCVDNPGARPKALQAIAKYRQFLTSDPRVQMCDVNPWNIVVGLKDTLLPALNDLEKALAG